MTIDNHWTCMSKKKIRHTEDVYVHILLDTHLDVFHTSAGAKLKHVGLTGIQKDVHHEFDTGSDNKLN